MPRFKRHNKANGRRVELEDCHCPSMQAGDEPSHRWIIAVLLFDYSSTSYSFMSLQRSTLKLKLGLKLEVLSLGISCSAPQHRFSKSCRGYPQ
jgi:hypothetical protein